MDELGIVLDIKSKEHKQYYPKPGWVEHDPVEIFNNTGFLLKEMIKCHNDDKNKIVSISITNQREIICFLILLLGCLLLMFMYGNVIKGMIYVKN